MNFDEYKANEKECEELFQELLNAGMIVNTKQWLKELLDNGWRFRPSGNTFEMYYTYEDGSEHICPTAEKNPIAAIRDFYGQYKKDLYTIGKTRFDRGQWYYLS